MRQGRLKRIFVFAFTLALTICLLPMHHTMADERENVTWSIKNDHGTAYLPRELTDDIASYFGFQTGDNKAVIFDKNTTVAIDYKKSKYKKGDVYLELWGLDVVKNSKGTHAVNFVTFSDMEFTDEPFRLVPGNLSEEVMCDPLLFDGEWTKFENIKNWKSNGTNYAFDLYFLRAYYGSKGAWTSKLFVPKGSKAITYNNKEYNYICRPVSSDYNDGAWEAFVDTKKKAQSFQLGIKAKGKITYKCGGGYIANNEKIVKANKYITVNKDGKVTIRKATPAGKYYILVNVAATSKYSRRTCWFKVNVK